MNDYYPSSNLRQRSVTLAKATGWITLAGIVVALSIAAVPLLLGQSMAQLVHESHGLVGFVFGIAASIGVAVLSTAIWLLTGRGLLDRLGL